MTRQPPTKARVYLFLKYFLYAHSDECRATHSRMLTRAQKIASIDIFIELKIVKSGMSSIVKNLFVALKYVAIPCAIRELMTHGTRAI